MEERYWLRHASLKGHQGPFEKKDLSPAIDSSAFPLDSEVLRDMGVTEVEREGSNGWMPVTELLGLEPVAPLPSKWPQPGVRSTPEPKLDSARLEVLRRASVYPNTRNLISTGMMVLVAAELILMAAQMSVLGGSSAAAIPVFTAVIAMIVTLIIGNVLLAVLDLADAAVRKIPHPSDE